MALDPTIYRILFPLTSLCSRCSARILATSGIESEILEADNKDALSPV